MQHFPLMARFNAWANRALYGELGRLSEEDLQRDRALFFGSIHRTLNHLLLVDRLWQGRIAGQDPVANGSIFSLDQLLYDNSDALSAARHLEDARLIALVEGLSPERLTAKVTYRKIIGEGRERTRIDHILIGLFNHQTHHRGQVHTVLKQIGIAPPPLDVMFFLEQQGLSDNLADKQRKGTAPIAS